MKLQVNTFLILISCSAIISIGLLFGLSFRSYPQDNSLDIEKANNEFLLKQTCLTDIKNGDFAYKQDFCYQLLTGKNPNP